MGQKHQMTRIDKFKFTSGTGTIGKALLFATILASTSIPASALVTACSSAATGTAISTYNALGTGCAAVNLSFENMALTGGSGSGGFVAPTTANTAVYSTGGGLVFNPITAGDWDAGTGDGTSALAATFSYVAISHSNVAYSGGGGTYTNAGTNRFWSFSSITLAGSGSVSNTAGQSMTVTQTVCFGVTTAAGCNASNQGILTASWAAGASTPTIGCSEGGAALSCASGVLNTTLTANQAYFSVTIAANRVSGGTLVDLNSFTLTPGMIASAPEPSTFGLLGAALAGLGALARKRRKS